MWAGSWAQLRKTPLLSFYKKQTHKRWRRQYTYCLLASCHTQSMRKSDGLDKTPENDNNLKSTAGAIQHYGAKADRRHWKSRSRDDTLTSQMPTLVLAQPIWNLDGAGTK